jgi:nitrite reductase/ring-hydroxylating ferredoxin subunit
MIRTSIQAAALAIALLTTSTAFAQEEGALQTTPNEIKYKDDQPNAKGTGEIGAVETRALLSRDGSAALEITTGDLDTGEPSTTANITKVQVKLNDTITNFNHLDEGSSFVLPLTGVTRYTPISVHTNVKGLNGGNTEVVLVNDKVRRRPDLKVVSVDAPSAVRLNQPFSISAVVRELNGDSGARTNCVLEKQGVGIVDRADGIWVDAGDSVQCLFDQTLDALGNQTYFVKLENTRPADWDTRLEFQAFNVLGATGKQWESAATQRVLNKHTVTTKASDPEHPSENIDTETFDAMRFHGVIDQPISFTGMQVSLEETTDGNLIYTYPALGFPPSSSGGCRVSDRRHAILRVCPFEDGLAVDLNSFAGQAVYISHFWNKKFNPSTGQFTWVRATITQRPSSGPRQRYGNTHAFHITVTDGNLFWEASPFINLAPYENPEERTTTCTTNDVDTFCTETTFQETGKTGSASLD